MLGLQLGYVYETPLNPGTAVKPEDIVAAKKAGKQCLYFTTNGVPLRQQWESVRDELRLIRIFQELGVRMMHLTYNRRNPIGDGAGEPSDGGLSDFGQAVVAEMNRLGVIVDVAHSGWRTSLEAAKASQKPMVASHTTCAGLYQHFRGKPDDTVKAICDTGGLIGICCIPRFLGGNGDLGAFLDHLDYGDLLSTCIIEDDIKFSLFLYRFCCSSCWSGHHSHWSSSGYTELFF